MRVDSFTHLTLTCISYLILSCYSHLAKKRSAKEVAAEKEALKKQEQEEMRRQVEALANMTPEEAAAEKRRIQKEQEDQDFALGADTFRK